MHCGQKLVHLLSIYKMIQKYKYTMLDNMKF